MKKTVYLITLLILLLPCSSYIHQLQHSTFESCCHKDSEHHDTQSQDDCLVCLVLKYDHCNHDQYSQIMPITQTDIIEQSPLDLIIHTPIFISTRSPPHYTSL